LLAGVNPAVVGLVPDQLFSHLERGWTFAMGTGIAAAALALAIGSPAREREVAVVEGLAPEEGVARA
jgi:hypothetical protein